MAVKAWATEIMHAGKHYRWAPTDEAPITRSAYENQELCPPNSAYRSPYDAITDGIATRLSLLRDFLDGVSLVCVHGGHPTRPVAFSVHGVARGALETLAYLYWTAEPDIPEAERRARLCADLTKQHQSRHRLDDYAAEDGHALEHRWDENVRLCEQWQVDHEQDGPDSPVRIYAPDGRRIIRPDALSVMGPLMPSATHRNVGAFFTYVVNDVMHASLEAALRPADVSRDESGHLTVLFSRPRILRNAAGIFWASYRPLKVVYSLMGWDVERVDRVMADHAQRLADAMADSMDVPREELQPIGTWDDHLADPPG